MGIYGAVAAAAEEHRRKQLLEKLKQLGSVDEKSAVPMEKICEYWYDKHRIEALIKKGKIGKTSDGKLYLSYLPCKDEK